MLSEDVLLQGSVLHPLGTVGTSGSMVRSRERVGGGVRGGIQIDPGSGVAGRRLEGYIRTTGSH